jgi:hypothetical protein
MRITLYLRLCFPASYTLLCRLFHVTLLPVPSHLKRALAAEDLACGLGALELEEEEEEEEEEALCVTWADDGSLSMQVKP